MAAITVGSFHSSRAISRVASEVFVGSRAGQDSNPSSSGIIESR